MDHRFHCDTDFIASMIVGYSAIILVDIALDANSCTVFGPTNPVEQEGPEKGLFQAMRETPIRE